MSKDAKVLQFIQPKDAVEVANEFHQSTGDETNDHVVRVLGEVMRLHGPRGLEVGLKFCGICRNPEDPDLAATWPCDTAGLIKDGLFS